MLNNLDPEPPRPETDGSEDDFGTDDAFNLLPEVDELNDVAEPETQDDASRILEAVVFTPAGSEHRLFSVGNESVHYFNGELNFLWNKTYRAGISPIGECRYLVEVPDGRYVKFIRPTDEEFFQIMAERGACSFDELKILRNKIDDLKAELDKTQAEYETAVDEYHGGDHSPENQDKTDKLRKRWREIHDEWCQLREDYKQKYRTGVRETCELINDAAPEGWNISATVTFVRNDIDHPKEKYRIHFHGEQIAELDTLALANFISIDEFFEQFKPLVDKNFTPAEQNIRARQREIDDLNEMRTELAGDTERVKILDELIDDAHREKIRNELAG